MERTNEPLPWHPATHCVHGGHRPSAAQPGVVAPVERSATFRLDEQAYALRAAGRLEDSRVYARESSPTVEVVEARLAGLEGAEKAALFASGQGAAAALLLACVPVGAPVMAARVLYGGTSKLLHMLLARQGSPVVRFDARDPESLERHFADGAALVIAESLSNPTLEVADVAGLAAVARSRGALFAVDATFATPMAQRPLDLGADLVWHSATKYLGGHSDLVAGVVAGSEERLSPIRRWRTVAGAVADPECAFLLDRGIKTLALRVRAQSEGAARIARYLAAHPDVDEVYHPSLPRDVGAALRARQLRLNGGMLAFVVRGGDRRAAAMLGHLSLVVEAASLGGVESLVSLPARMSHSDLTEREREALGIRPGLVRLSVGIEDPSDLERDLHRALLSSRGV